MTKCPYGNHHHYTLRSYRLCHSRGFNHDINCLMLHMLNMGLEMALKHEKSKRRIRASRAERKKREEIMEEKKMYKLVMTGVEQGNPVSLVIFGASDMEVYRFLRDLENLVLRIGEVEP